MEPPKLVENAGTNLKADIAAHMDGIARLIDAEWKRLHEREEQLAKERAAFEEMRAKIASVHVPDRIKLCVGGTVFATSREHLMRDPESMLAAMFSGRGFKAEPDADGTYFIDRDPEHFPTIMNYLRYGKIQLPADSEALSDLIEEAEFYQLRELSQAARGVLAGMSQPSPPAVSPPPPVAVRTDGLAPVAASAPASAPAAPKPGADALWPALRAWLPTLRDTALLFRASRDGWTASAYHAACDGKAPTVTVFRCVSGCVFGAYSSVARKSSNNYIADPSAFLFTVANPRGTPPVQFPVKDASRAVWDGPSDLAVFGGHDIFPPRSPTTDDGYLRFPLSFVDVPNGAGRLTFTNNYAPLRLAELEVYQLTLGA